ncbi:DNA cytosine methyltransferase [Lysinibacter cavernae]|uniref:DNA cytosine methyltransferase n=1 Tax=Lysinibacter cavernae TaxID=1640652 RepID=UPI00361E74BE
MYSRSTEPTSQDFFAGFGGASTGLFEAGFNIVAAYNHWNKAIEVHSANHQNTRHVQGDLSGYDMRCLPWTWMLWASPECTWHSPAGGRSHSKYKSASVLGEAPLPVDAAVRSRATMYDPIRAAEARNFDVVVIENVPEVAKWPLFTAWLKMWEALGYVWQTVNVSAAHVYGPENAPAGQWRDRIYIVFTKKGMRQPNLNPSPPAHCPRCNTVVATRQHWKKKLPEGTPRSGKYGPQYFYVCDAGNHDLQAVEPFVLPAESIIDWSDLGIRIGDRASLGMRDLSAATLRRVEVGHRMFARPAVVAHSGQTWDAANPDHPRYGDPSSYYRAWAADSSPLNARQAGGSGDAITVPPFITAVNHDSDKRAFDPAGHPLPTRSTKIGDGLIFPSVVTEHYGTGTARQIDNALSTVTAGGNHHGIAVPPGAFISKHHGGLDYQRIEHMNKPVSSPLPTIVASPNVSLVTPERKRPKDMYEGELPFDIDDVRFRMLKPEEHLRAQRFPDSYDTSAANKSETTAGAGNAVPVNVAHWIGKQLLEIM